MRSNLILRAALAVALPAVAACGNSDRAPVDGDAIIIGDTDAGSGDATADADGGLPPCADNTDCAGGEVCREGVCREICDVDAPCDGPLAVCDPTTGLCVGCLSDDDCSGDQLCDAATQSCVDPECASDDECPGGFECQSGECVSIDDIICAAESSRCEGDTLILCSRDGTSETTADCDPEERCIEETDALAACLPVICEPNAVDCSDPFTASLCDTTGTAVDEFPCNDGEYCELGACLPQACEAGVATCEGDVVVACDERGSASTTTVCAETEACAASDYGCACVDATCTPRVCTPGAGQCVGNNSRTCAADGLAWSALTDCGADALCVEGICLDLVCEPGAVECAGEQVATCGADGTTRTFVDCAATGQLCASDASGVRCAAPICTPDAVTCAATGEAVEACDARGSAVTTTPCEAGTWCSGGACVPQVCAPGSAAVCVGGDAQQCNARGSAYAVVDDCVAGTELCVAGSCRAIVCEAGLTYCDAETLRTCSADGTSETVTDCAASSQWCNDATNTCVPRVCTPGSATICLGGDEQRCNANGSAYELIRDCGTAACVAGACDLPCGDGVLDSGEECDLGLANGPTATCTATCLLNREVLCDGVALENCVVLPLDGASVVQAVTERISTRPIDMVFQLDGTGSAQAIETAFQAAWSVNILPALLTLEPDAAFALGSHNAFAAPCDPFGSGVNPFQLRQRITTRTANITAAVSQLSTVGPTGAGDFESLTEALFQIATGRGFSSTFCPDSSSPAFNPSANEIVGVQDGVVGGVGFRSGTQRVAFYLTDAPPYDKSDLDIHVGASFAETVRALLEQDIRPIGVVTPDTFSAGTVAAYAPLAIATHATVPACAWDGLRTAGCPAGLCCTGPAFAGRAPTDGECPLVYETDSSSSQIGAAISDATRIAGSLLRWDVTIVPVADPAAQAASGIDTSCFLAGVEATGFGAGSPVCGGSPFVSDARESGAGDALGNLPLNVSANFDLTFANRCVSPATSPRTFDLTLRFATVDGYAFASTPWRVIIPPVPPATGAARCGDGVVNGGETCDDGNRVNDDACTNICRVPRCGDAILNSAPGTRTFTSPLVAGVGAAAEYVCDDGASCVAGTCSVVDDPFAPEHGMCRALGYRRATAATWGGGLGGGGNSATSINAATEWQCLAGFCDDGIAGSADCYPAEMLASLTCADTNEECDSGAANGNTPNACRANCQLPSCGDLVVDSGEECDDGDSDNFDGCSNACLTRSCGDGLLQASRGEECDNGAANADVADACRTNCRLAFCGDLILDSTEECDDGNANEDDGCNSQCELPSCGNGVVESGEACDDGNLANDDLCTTTCQETYCGDGVLQTVAGEECDDANAVETDACTSACVYGPGCVDFNLGSSVGTGVVAVRSILGAGNDYASASCGMNGRGPDHAYTWTAPSTGTYRFDTFGATTTFDTILILRDRTLSTCGGEELQTCTVDGVYPSACCEDDTTGGTSSTQSALTASVTAGVTYLLIVDAYSASASGNYVLNITAL